MGLFSFLGGKSPEELELEGEKYYKLEEFGAAKIEYEKALEKAQKKFPEKTNLISRLLKKLTLAKEALATTHLENARLLIQSQNHDEAEGLLRLVLELSDDESIKGKATEELIAIRKNWNLPAAKAHDAFETILKHVDHREGDHPIDDYFSVLCSTLSEDTQEEYRRYGQSFQAGYVALNSGEFEKAADFLEASMREHPHPHSQIPVELATALVHLNQFDEAAVILENYVADNPDSLRGYQALCEVYWDTGKFNQAIDLLGSSPDELKTSLPVRMLLGETRYLEKKYSEAVNVFESAIAEFGFNELTARSLAKAYEACGNIQKAKDLYSQILIGCRSCGTRTDPFIKGRYADLCFQSGEKSDRLLELYFSLVQEDPDNKLQYYQRIHKIYEDIGNDDQARRYRAMADSIAPR
ncbi:MAG: tetratricopeptide repeat protein [Desulfobacterales bacterium]|nr:tetratricopeptide repeat protein [Desulfobacterales bacterium]